MLAKLGYGKGRALNQRCPHIFTLLPFLWIDGNMLLWAELAPWLGQGQAGALLDNGLGAACARRAEFCGNKRG